MKVINLFDGLKNTSYQSCDYRQINQKYLVHIVLKIITLNFLVTLWSIILSLKILASRMYVHIKRMNGSISRYLYTIYKFYTD